MTRWILGLMACLTACGGGDLLISPTAFPLGEVNVQEDRPPAGYSARDLVLTNQTGRNLDIELLDVDSTRIFIAAPFFASDDPPTLPSLAPEETVVLTVGAWDYELGELTTELSGSFRIEANGVDSVSIPWSFTPVRERVEDTASP